jgi:hypothetical protein
VSLQEIALIAGVTPSTTGKQSPSTRDFWQASYFPPLDGLRALSVLLVIGGHARTVVPLKRYFSGGLGVGVFFVLSGFLITTLLLREEFAKGSISFGGFYIRRFFRIFPPYFLTVGVYLLIGLIPSQHELRTKVFNGLPYFLSLRNEYIPKGLEVAFTHSWSLSVEEKFYFFWPVLFFLVLRKLKARWAVLPITLVPLLISTSATLPVAYFSLLSGARGAIALQLGQSDSPYSGDYHLARFLRTVFSWCFPHQLYHRHGGYGSALTIKRNVVVAAAWFTHRHVGGQTHVLYVFVSCIGLDRH